MPEEKTYIGPYTARPMKLSDIMPSFRCVTYNDGTYVEIPDFWKTQLNFYNDKEVFSLAVATMNQLLKSEKESQIFDEFDKTGNHRKTRKGYLVRIEKYDEMMARPVPNYEWRTAD